MNGYDDDGHSAVLRTLPLSGLLNRRICGSLTLSQICPYGETSRIPHFLCEIMDKIEMKSILGHSPLGMIAKVK